MKKILFAAAAAFALVACEQEKVTEVPQDLAISFGQTFVEGTYYRTKVADPSTTTESITGFNVWGYMDDTSCAILEAEDVDKVNGAWTYLNTQYWTPGHTYYFAALAPKDSENWALETAGANEYGAGVVSFKNVDGTEDLLYTSKNVTTPDMATLTAAGMPEVDFIFNHLLSKIKFTFGNAFETSNYTVEVKDVKMSVPAEGTIDLAVENWWDNDDWTLGQGETVLAFGDVVELGVGERAAAADQRLTIPAAASQEYAVSFTIVMYVSGLEAMEVQKTAVLKNVAFKMGKSYNIMVELNPDNLGLHPIVFDVVEVKDWDEAGNVYLPDYMKAVKVATAAEFEAALAAKCPSITLVNDIELTSDITKVTGDLVLDLNGFNISAERNMVNGSSAAQISTLYIEGVKLTVAGTGKILNVGEKGGHAVTVSDDGTCVIKGNVTVGSYYNAFYVRKGDLYIEDGFHYASVQSRPSVDAEGCHTTTVVNCFDNYKCKQYFLCM